MPKEAPPDSFEFTNSAVIVRILVPGEYTDILLFAFPALNKKQALHKEIKTVLQGSI